MPCHEALGEILRAFQLGGFLGWPENLQPTCAEYVDDAGRQRRFRADDGEVNFFLFGEIGERLRIGNGQVFHLDLVRRARISRCDVDFLKPRRFGEAPGQCMFATAGTDDE